MPDAKGRKGVAIVTCSVRSPRLNPYISAYVRNYLYDILPKGIALKRLDLASPMLPRCGESDSPKATQPANPTLYRRQSQSHEWTGQASEYDAFIFVTPQYNGTFPPSVRNALAYLRHECAGKPAAVVTYGSRGGKKAGEQLKQVLESLYMQTVRTSPSLICYDGTLNFCMEEGGVSDDLVEIWAQSGIETDLKEMMKDLERLLR